MLRANPGLTPPLIKASLQYSAQPLPKANLLQQGAGMRNVDGAVALAKVLRSDIGPAIEARTLVAGSPLIAPGKTLASRSSVLNGQTAKWSRIVVDGGGGGGGGGNIVISGDALMVHQPIREPRTTWANGIVERVQPVCWSGSGIAANTFVKGFNDSTVSSKGLLSAWLESGSGGVLAGGAVLSNGIVMSRGIVMSETGAELLEFATEAALNGEP